MPTRKRPAAPPRRTVLRRSAPAPTGRRSALPRRAARGLVPVLRRRLPAPGLDAARRGDRRGPADDALDLGAGDGLGPALRLAEPAARHRLVRLALDHRRDLLPRRPPRPRLGARAATSARCRSSATTAGSATSRSSAITDIGFPESVLLDNDAWLCHLLRRPEFQRRMTGCEFRYLLGAPLRRGGARGRRARGPARAVLAQGDPDLRRRARRRQRVPELDEALGAARGGGRRLRLRARPARRGLRDAAPTTTGACSSREAQEPRHADPRRRRAEELQPAARAGALADPRLRGRRAATSTTSRSRPRRSPTARSRPARPAEAVTWGKVDKDHYKRTTESFTCDYSVVMPFLAQGAARQARPAGEAARGARRRRARSSATPRPRATCATRPATGSTTGATSCWRRCASACAREAERIRG